ncbi:hypothetical protein [Streptomyces sp. NPDC058664]|uniref:hypothetical protein n=1 Tax=unclassified Streptomyces TaxID=2593676 RepID=UPI003659DACF
MILCRIRHAWSPWREELQECPDGELVTVAVWRRDCRRCFIIDEREEVLSCV